MGRCVDSYSHALAQRVVLADGWELTELEPSERAPRDLQLLCNSGIPAPQQPLVAWSTRFHTYRSVPTPQQPASASSRELATDSSTKYKPGIVAAAPGSLLILKLPELAGLREGRPLLTLQFLSSYQGMGVVRATCGGDACACDPTEVSLSFR